ncbi:serine protease [Streptomyces sp. CHD11]|uniref:S1 family peptidase n=1 Tax=Streptomyces sp. CHD11 TaxID=2741325 RepID=UPI001BFC5004|nr:serine protease [Streptomyces sp. CHD11]MBT3155516.1 serine protease [Streptomyces sp. CHD11]
MSGIRRLLTDCLVRISGSGAAGGTGFFVAPGTVLTCAHVVSGAEAGQLLRAEWQGGGARARLIAVHPTPNGRSAPGPYPYPDLAVLAVERSGHPCVRLDLDEPRWEDRVHGCGYTRTWSRDDAQVEPVTFTYEGVHEVGGGLLKLAGGQAVPGMSGGPLLNLRTMGVCGVLKTTRDPALPTGGWGVPVGLLRELHPEVVAAHDAFHHGDRRWREAADAVSPLLAGLTAFSASYAGRIENFLVEYLGRDGAPVPFGGRDLQMNMLTAWLADPQAAPYALVAAEAGRGKSALLVRWAREVMRQERAHVVVVPVSIRFNTAQAGVVFPALATRLGEVYGEPPGATDMSAEQWKETCLGYLRRPPPDGRPLLVVMDGLDEATDWQPGPDLFPAAPGRGVRVLASARHLAGGTDDRGWLARLNWDSLAVSLPLPPMDRDGVRQVLHAMGDPLAGLATKVDVVSELYRLSEGDPLLVRLYVEALLPYGERAAAINADELPSISTGLEGYFSRWWDEQERQWRDRNRNPTAERQDLEDFLNVLACALGPLGHDDLTGIMPRPLSWLRLRALTSEVGRFVIGDGRDTGFVYSHPRLGMYFRELMGQVERDAWDERFLAHGRRALAQAREGTTAVPPYAVRFHGAHLERAQAPDEDLYALVDGGWLRACQALEGGDSTFLNDSERAWRRAEARCDERAFEVRFLSALARASVAARSDGIPVALVDMAARAGILPPAQALALCRRMTYEHRRSAAVVRLAEVVGPEWLDECVAVAATVRATARRSATLAGLSPYLHEQSARRAVTVARSLEASCPRAIALAALSVRLPWDERLALAGEALDSCAADEDGVRRGRALVLMASHLPENLLPRAVRLARRTPDPLIAIRSLCALARHLSKVEARAAVEEARGRQEEVASVSHNVRARFALAEFAAPEKRDDLLSELVHVTPQVRHSLLIDARPWLERSVASLPSAIYDDLRNTPPADSEELVAALPGSVRRRLCGDLEVRGGDDRIESLLFHAHLLAAEGHGETSDAVLRLLGRARDLDRPVRAAALTALAACHRGEAADVLLREALDCAQLIDDAHARAELLSDVATNPSEQILADLECDLVFRPGRLSDGEVLSFLGGKVPLADAAVSGATARVARIADDDARLQALMICVQRAPERHRGELGRYALTEALAQQNTKIRATALQRLAQLPLPLELRHRVDIEQRRTLERITRVEYRLAMLGGDRVLAGMLSTAVDKERVIRECVVPLLVAIVEGPPFISWSAELSAAVEALFGTLPHRLSEDLAALLWNIADEAQPWLRPWLLAPLVSRLPAGRVVDAVSQVRALEIVPPEDANRFQHVLAEEVAKVFPLLAPEARALLLGDALGRNPTLARIRALMPVVGADQVEDVLRHAQELPFPARVAATMAVRQHVDTERFTSFLKLLTDTALVGGPGVGPTPLIDLARLVNDVDRDHLLDAAAVALAHRKPSERRKVLDRLSARDRGRIVRFLLQRKALEPEELTPFIVDLPTELLGDAEQTVLSIESPQHRLTALGALATAAGRHTPERLWTEVLRAVRADLALGDSTDGLLGLLQQNLPDVDNLRVSQLRAFVEAVDDSETRIALLCALARHARAPLRGALLASALDAAGTIVQDQGRAAALMPIAQSAVGWPDAVVRTLDAIVGIRPPDGRQRVLRAHVPALRDGIASGTVDVTVLDRALRELSRMPRPLVVRDMALLATVGAALLPDNGGVPRAFLKAMYTVGGWWS